MKKAGKRLLSLLLATLLILTLIPGVVWGAEEKLTEEIVEENMEEIVEENKEATVEESTEETAEESEELVGADDYTFDMVLSKDSDYHVGDTVTLTAQVYRNGEKVTDLAEAGLYVYFWKDEWTGDYQTEGYTLENDGNSGRSLTATVTFTEPGEYNVGYNLQDSTWSTIAGNNYAQFSVTEEAQQGTSVTVVPDITDDLHVGDTVTLTATLTQDGVKITDLNTVDCYMYFWGDDWSDDYCHNFTMEKDDNGKSLSAKITFHEAGTYRVGYDVEDAEWKKIVPDTYIEFEVKEEVKPVEADIDVERVSTLTDDFIMGMDISSAPSLIDAGVVYGDWDGNALDGDDSQAKLNKFVQFLADNGITHVRVRIWNDPFDADENGYGGGNCDVSNAVRIARACAGAGVGMLIDFHYSDFWADPGRQLVPKAWRNYDSDLKEAELGDFTAESLLTIAQTGAQIDMVQVGNETTSGIAGTSSSDIPGMCRLFSEGAMGVRAFSEIQYGNAAQVKVVIHVTNPESGNMTTWAKRLADNNVDYDVLATSYYPYWHGTLANLKNQMKTVKDTYGKNVMVAETSYTYTLEDSDGFTNTIPSEAAKGANATYPSTVQGQATAIREVINATSEVGGLGVFYWEPAWITVGDTTGKSGDELDAIIANNQLLWEEYGCGWAAKAAAEYDPNVGPDGIYAGGSPIDNEAMFGPDGMPLQSLHVWEYVKTGAESTVLLVDKVDSPEITVDLADDLANAVEAALPGHVDVTYSKANIGTIGETAAWSEEDIAAITGVGTYEVHGDLTLSHTCSDGATSTEAICTVIVREANILTHENIYGFEKADGYELEGSGMELPSNQDVLAGYHSLHWYSPAAVTDKATTKDAISLDKGWYTLEITAMGKMDDTVTLNILDSDGKTLASGEPLTLQDWTADPSEFLSGEVTFFIDSAKDVKLQVELGVKDGGWGSVDSLYLHKHQDVTSSEKKNADGSKTITYTCGDCGKFLGTEEIGPVKVTSVSLDRKSASIYVGKSLQLKATVKPDDAQNKAVTWKSSNTAVATVDSKGLVKALKVGSATITVTTKDGKKTATCNFTVKEEAVPIYRLYNPNSGEHFFTGSATERDNLIKLGWKNEKIGWYAAKKSSIPVYRLYNKNAGNDHFYTKSASEKDKLVKLGWKYEGIAFYASETRTTPVYRAYNPNAKMGTHHFTKSKSEYDTIVKLGWKAEKIAWYAVK